MNRVRELLSQIMYRRSALELSDDQLNDIFSYLGQYQHDDFGMTILMTLLRYNPTTHVRQRVLSFLKEFAPAMPRPNFLNVNNALTQLLELWNTCGDASLRAALLPVLKQVINSLQPDENLSNLAWIVVYMEDADIRQMALARLYYARSNTQLSQIVELWINSRHPDLEALIIERKWDVTYMSIRTKVLLALKTDNFRLIVPLRTLEIKEIVVALEDQDESIRRRAVLFMQTMEEKYLEAAAQQWLTKRNPTLLNILAERDYIPAKPPATRIMVALKLGKLDLVTSLKPDKVALLGQATTDNDLSIADNARLALTQLTKPASQQMLCKLVIENDWSGATQAALEANYLPTEPTTKTLFYFVTEQWERYEGLDFDGRVLRTYYEAANPALKRRLAAKVRAAGRVDYLSAIAGGENRTRMTQVTTEEAGLLVRVLEDNREWARLWALAVEVPLEWSVYAVRRLTKAHWQPDAPAERQLFEELSLLANQPITTAEAEINRQVVPAVRRAKVRVPGRINDLAFAPGGPLLAIGTGLGRLVLWNAQTARRENVLSGFEHSIGQVAFLPGGQLLCAEKTSTKTGLCNLYECRPATGELVKLGQAQGSFTALVAAGNGQALAATRDRSVTLWQLDQLNLWKPQKQSLYYWARGLVVKPDGTVVAVLSHNAELRSLPSLAAQNVAHLGQIGQVATFSPDETALIVGRSDGQLTICTLEKGQFAETSQTRNDLTDNESAIEGLASISHLKTVIAASANGNLDFIDWPKGERTGRVFAEATPLTALKLSPDGAFMAVGDLNGTFSLWDLRVLELRRLFGLPLAKGQSVHMAALTTLNESGIEMVEPARHALAYVEAVLRFRFRFDVELSDLPNVQVGEFDIEIEG